MTDLHHNPNHQLVINKNYKHVPSRARSTLGMRDENAGDEIEFVDRVSMPGRLAGSVSQAGRFGHRRSTSGAVMP